ncbi:exosome complex component RRP41-like [Antedon mediterranea]|uniref:exosome complex component RRP41-like n=1 Tax=Antedon mediterranea TaxID=105859 RepID=UPI003AF4E9ED
MELLSDQGFRVDGRKPHELRKVQCRLGVLNDADGSAYIEQGNTKVLAVVYGPHEVRGGKSKSQHDKVILNCQYSMATFSTGERKRRPKGDKQSQEISLNLRRAFEAAICTELYPHSQIDIFWQVLQSDGGNLSVCINTATLALIDAGIPMNDYVCSCSASFVNDTPLLDVSYIEESQGGPEMVVALFPRSEKIVHLKMTSRLHMDHLSKVTDLACKGSRDMFGILNQAVRLRVSGLSQSMQVG